MNSEDYFADHVDILDSKIKICQFCQQSFAFRNLLHKHFWKKNYSKKPVLRIHQSSKNHQFNKDHLISQNSQFSQIHQFCQSHWFVQNLHQNLHQSDQNCWSNHSQNYFVLLNNCKLLKRYRIYKCSVFKSTNKEKIF